MAKEHTLSITRRNGATAVTSNLTKTGGSEIGIDEDIPVGATNLQFTSGVAFVAAKLQYIWIQSDKALTLEFNNSGTGVPTINLVAGEPFVWEKRQETLLPNPFTADVTTLYVTNASGAIANLKIDGVVDPT